ncbi:MAG: sodium:solute symporter family protein [Candidatus Bathyarchaeia archaeon]
MVLVIAIVCLYFLALLIIGFYAKKQLRVTAEDYFLASRTIGTFIMCLSVFATLYSAFTFIALPGLIYKTGVGFVAALPVSNVLFAPMMFLIGYKIWLAGKKFRFITPTELFRHRFNSRAVSAVIFVAMVMFVLPYISIQPMGGGYVLSTLTGNVIPYKWGAAIITAIMAIYVFYGGFRGVAWVDAFQAIVMLVTAIGTLGYAVSAVGGFATGSSKLMIEVPKFLSPEGPVGLWSWPNVLSWVVFITLNFMFQPQIFVRYYSAKSADTLRVTTALWPLLATIILIFPIMAAMYGRILFPGLGAPDTLIPNLWMRYTPSWFCGLGVAAIMSALMSTASGQIMVLSSMFTRDVYLSYLTRTASDRKQAVIGRIAVLVIIVIGFLLSLKPPALLGLMAGAAFSGIAILAPAGIAAFYWRRATAPAVILSVICGEIPVVLTYFNVIPKSTWGKFDASIPGLVLATFLLIVVSLLTKAPPKEVVEEYFSKDMDIFGDIGKEEK